MRHVNDVCDSRNFKGAPNFRPLKIGYSIAHYYPLKLLSAEIHEELLPTNAFAGASICSFVRLTAGAALSVTKIRYPSHLRGSRIDCPDSLV